MSIREKQYPPERMGGASDLEAQREAFKKRLAEEQRRMKSLLEELKSRGIKAIGKTDGNQADLKTPDWIVCSIAGKVQGFVTSYRNEQEIIEELSKQHLFDKLWIYGADSPIFSRVQPSVALLKFAHFRTDGNSGVLLCQKELWKRMGWDEQNENVPSPPSSTPEVE